MKLRGRRGNDDVQFGWRWGAPSSGIPVVFLPSHICSVAILKSECWILHFISYISLFQSDKIIWNFDSAVSYVGCIFQLHVTERRRAIFVHVRFTDRAFTE